MSDDPVFDPQLADTVDPMEERPTVAPGEDPLSYPGAALGPYRILQEIGRGGMGVVYKAFHPQLKRTVALKVLIAGEDASKGAIERFQREAEAVARLGHHPNIVPVYDIGREKNLHYFAMHFVHGKSLDRLIDQGDLFPKSAARIAEKTARALEHAHRLGILHRDVKPANILITPEGEPRLTDFGLAKDVATDSRFTRPGVSLGTPQYMPPEQARGNLQAIDARSDVYSLGATLYEMLTMSPPFEGDTVLDVTQKLLSSDARAPRARNPGVDRDLETICLKCIQKSPARRYQSAGELADDLDRYLQGQPIVARPSSPLEKFGKRFRRISPAAAAFLVSLGAIALIAAMYGFGFWEWKGDPAGMRPPPADRAGIRAQVDKIGSGHTIWVEFGGKKGKVRLLNLDAPESGKPFCNEAREHLRALIGGKDVLLVPEKPDGGFTVGGLNRLLAYVFAGDVNVNVEMVRAGWSPFHTKFGEGRFAGDFAKAEREAKAAKRGIWRAGGGASGTAGASKSR